MTQESAVRVWCDGCFDLVHYGHANSMRQAKALGNVLVVGVHNDYDITANKGPPVFTEEERYQMVRAVKWVDEVVEGSTYFPSSVTLTENNCNFAAHGDDLSITKDGKDPYLILKDEGLLRIFNRTVGVSTTDIVKRLLRLPFAREVGHEFVSDNYRKKSEYVSAINFVQFSSGRIANAHDKIVYVAGSFDLLHPGHLEFLQRAAAEGTYLIVGLYTDEVVKRRHGPGYPIMRMPERALSLLACRHVDDVVFGADETITAEFITSKKIDLVCQSKLDSTFPDAKMYSVPKQMGNYKLIDTGNNTTTEMVAQRVILNSIAFELRNKKKEEREDVLAKCSGLAGLGSTELCLTSPINKEIRA